MGRSDQRRAAMGTEPCSLAISLRRRVRCGRSRRQRAGRTTPVIEHALADRSGRSAAAGMDPAGRWSVPRPQRPRTNDSGHAAGSDYPSRTTFSRSRASVCYTPSAFHWQPGAAHSEFICSTERIVPHIVPGLRPRGMRGQLGSPWDRAAHYGVFRGRRKEILCRSTGWPPS